MARTATKTQSPALAVAAAQAAQARASPAGQAQKNALAQARDAQAVRNIPLLKTAFNASAASAFPTASD